jgi:hypothetical protein
MLLDVPPIIFPEVKEDNIIPVPLLKSLPGKETAILLLSGESEI